MAIKKKIIEDAIELTKDIPATDEEVLAKFDSLEWTDVLTPLEANDEINLTPEPQAEYDVVIDTNIDKLIKDVNVRLKNWWSCIGWVQVTSWAYTKFYQTLVRWNVDVEITPISNLFDEDEENLYEDVE